MPEGGEEGERELEQAVDKLEHAEADLARAASDERRAEHEIEEARREIERAEHHRTFDLIVNRRPHTWPEERIDGLQIKDLAGSPADWIVNQIIDGPGEDPEIGDHQLVNLAIDAPPPGVKRFTTRKPKTSPGTR